MGDLDGWLDWLKAATLYIWLPTGQRKELHRSALSRLHNAIPNQYGEETTARPFYDRLREANGKRPVWPSLYLFTFVFWKWTSRHDDLRIYRTEAEQCINHSGCKVDELSRASNAMNKAIRSTFGTGDLLEAVGNQYDILPEVARSVFRLPFPEPDSSPVEQTRGNSAPTLDQVNQAEREYHLGRFSGRSPLVEKYKTWVRRHAEGRYLLIVGPPGAGKSALSAKIAEEALSDVEMCALHFLKSEPDPTRFVPLLAAKINPGSAGAEDLQTVFQRLTGRRVALILDGIDEAPPGSDISSILPRWLPKGVRVILTSLRQPSLITKFRARLEQLDVEDLPGLSKSDVEGIVRRRELSRAAPELFRRIGTSELPSPLILHMWLDQWTESARVAKFAVPPRLEDLVGRLLEHALPGLVLRLLAVARSPLKAEELHLVLRGVVPDLSLVSVRKAIDEVSSVLREHEESKFFLCHGSIAAYLRNHIGQHECEHLHGHFCKWLDTNESEYRDQHYTYHLAQAGLLAEAVTRITDLEHIQARARKRRVRELTLEYDEVLGAWPSAQAWKEHQDRADDEVNRFVAELSGWTASSELPEPPDALSAITGPALERHDDKLSRLVAFSNFVRRHDRHLETHPDLVRVLAVNVGLIPRESLVATPWLRDMFSPSISHRPAADMGTMAVPEHRTSITALAATPDLSIAVTGDDAGRIQFWDIAQRTMLAEADPPFDTTVYPEVTDVAVSVDGNRILSGRHGLFLWEFSQGRLTPRSVFECRERLFCFVADARCELALCSAVDPLPHIKESADIWLIDIKSGATLWHEVLPYRHIWTPELATNWTGSVFLVWGPTYLAAFNRDGRLWAENREKFTTRGASLPAQTDEALVVEHGQLIDWNVSSNKAVPWLASADLDLEKPRLTPDGQAAVVASYGTVTLVSRRERRVLKSVPLDFDDLLFVPSCDARKMLAVRQYNVRLYDIATGEDESETPVDIQFVASKSDGSLVILQEDTVSIVMPEPWTILEVRKIHGLEIKGSFRSGWMSAPCYLSKDETYLVLSADPDKTYLESEVIKTAPPGIYVVHIGTGAAHGFGLEGKAELLGLRGDVAISASRGDSQSVPEVCLWDWKSGQVLTRIPGLSLDSVSKDGLYACSVQKDGENSRSIEILETESFSKVGSFLTGCIQCNPRFTNFGSLVLAYYGPGDDRWNCVIEERNYRGERLSSIQTGALCLLLEPGDEDGLVFSANFGKRFDEQELAAWDLRRGVRAAVLPSTGLAMSLTATAVAGRRLISKLSPLRMFELCGYYEESERHKMVARPVQPA